MTPATPATPATAATPAAPAAPPATPAAPSRIADAALAPPTPARIDKRLHALDPAQRVALLYRQMVDTAQTGQRQTALAQARQLLDLQPLHQATRLVAAQLEQEGGAPDRALALLREGLSLQPRQSALALPAARLLALAGAADEAMALLDEHGVTGPEADGLRAGVLARRGDFAAALDSYEAAARAQPLNPMWWLGLGVALESVGEPARARLAFAKAQAIGLPRGDLTHYVEQRLRALE
ncbi:MAG: tetratricopeptide repeat protein [Rubrivivax sp.]|nr:tetratricopeptide repeat protein [Rubrivivax sp.]